MLTITQGMFANAAIPNTISQLMTEIFNNLNVTGMDEKTAGALRSAAMNSAHATEAFGQYLVQQAGYTIVDDVLSIA